MDPFPARAAFPGAVLRREVFLEVELDSLGLDKLDWFSTPSRTAGLSAPSHLPKGWPTSSPDARPRNLSDRGWPQLRDGAGRRGQRLQGREGGCRPPSGLWPRPGLTGCLGEGLDNKAVFCVNKSQPSSHRPGSAVESGWP